MANYIEVKDFCNKKGIPVTLYYNEEEVYKIKDGNRGDIKYIKYRCQSANSCNDSLCPRNIKTR